LELERASVASSRDKKKEARARAGIIFNNTMIMITKHQVV